MVDTSFWFPCNPSCAGQRRFSLASAKEKAEMFGDILPSAAPLASSSSDAKLDAHFLNQSENFQLFRAWKNGTHHCVAHGKDGAENIMILPRCHMD